MCADQGFCCPWGVCAGLGGVAHVCACVRTCMCVCGCVYPSTPTLAFPGTGISKKFLDSLNQEVWRLERAKTVASGALLPETLSCLCGKGAVLGGCVCGCVSTKCVDSHVQSPSSLFKQMCAITALPECTSVWVPSSWDCRTDVCPR